jgi:hypothetical protein
MDTEILRPHCHYRRRENGLNEFVFITNTRLAVDDFFAILESSPMAQGEKVADVIRMLVELREPGMPPVAYMMQRYREFIKVHKDHLPAIRTAYLYRTGFILSMVRSFMRLLTMPKQSNRRFFPIAEREQAEAWLLEEEQPTPVQSV